jgi:hypothetical protein
LLGKSAVLPKRGSIRKHAAGRLDPENLNTHVAMR